MERNKYFCTDVHIILEKTPGEMSCDQQKHTI